MFARIDASPAGDALLGVDLNDVSPSFSIATFAPRLGQALIQRLQPTQFSFVLTSPIPYTFFPFFYRIRFRSGIRMI